MLPSQDSRNLLKRCRVLMRLWSPSSTYLPHYLMTARFLTACIRGYDHRGVVLSAGVQRMVRSDLASSGVMFTIDTESGFDQLSLSHPLMGWGNGGTGAVNPDEFYVHKLTFEKAVRLLSAAPWGSKKSRWFMRMTPATANRCVLRMWMQKMQTFLTGPTAKWKNWQNRPLPLKTLRPSDGHRVGERR